MTHSTRTVRREERPCRPDRLRVSGVAAVLLPPSSRCAGRRALRLVA
jgi:hypothetical protein